MREIKFRSWDSLNKQMTETIDLSQSREYWKQDWLGVYDFPIMQFTGLKDKNGKEIYEGDILYDEINDEKLLVFWDKCGTWKIGRVWACNYSADGADEVIGNIYENPELLGGQDERG